MDDTRHPAHTDLLGVYLNDHLAGCALGVERARCLAEAERGTSLAEALRPVVREFTEDRVGLLQLMRSLDVPVRRYKILASRLAERAGRLKSNGRIVQRSPLTTVVELEALRLVVEGKAACWRMLRRLAGTDGRLDPVRLDSLLERAGRQADTLERLRLRHAEKVFRPAGEGSARYATQG
ncbi:hypothetical protein [Streptomyces minutiscleroticus]|uniref:hypothetical protein n=1 Tax=Streptomyces minutiscleroticus TaxID=68238 RepID=UPI0033233490